ncbi:MAG: hypothetical protein PWQ75_2309 [Methanolobus sp.]|jgi:hypothetical protein|uniref:hypothetical protein n=1 Tax=Methanolobus sp. TaxID=1874737 RepID=UPI00258743FA|nr:hypothetical protein [Methanolobus sp.]MDK2832557.1 hypothetical protein [Methanolobus sp.]
MSSKKQIDILTKLGLTIIEKTHELINNVDFKWICVCNDCLRPASYYILPSYNWKWYCSYIDCSNDIHGEYEDTDNYTVIPILMEEYEQYLQRIQ